MKENKYEINHTYLIRYGVQKQLFQVKVLGITEKAYRLCWYSSDNKTSNTWTLIEQFNYEYDIVEDITEYMNEKWIKELEILGAVNDKYLDKEKHIKRTIVTCWVCNGTGITPDTTSTSGSKPCPHCYGSRLVTTSIETKI